MLKKDTFISGYIFLLTYFSVIVVAGVLIRWAQKYKKNIYNSIVWPFFSLVLKKLKNCEEEKNIYSVDKMR